MKTCGDTQRNLSAYFDGELDPAPRQRVAAHLAACPFCQARLKDFSRISSLLRQGRLCTIPPGLWLQIAKAAPKQGPLTLRRWLIRTGAVAAGFSIYLLGHSGMTTVIQSGRASQFSELKQTEQVLQDTASVLAGRGLTEEVASSLTERPELLIFDKLQEQEMLRR